MNFSKKSERSLCDGLGLFGCLVVVFSLALGRLYKGLPVFPSSSFLSHVSFFCLYEPPR
jgi:hypothetical protein